MNAWTGLLLAFVQGTQAPGPAAPPTSAPAASPPRAPCTAPVHRHFDFWIGTWDVLNADGKFVGKNRVERVGDCFLQENWAASRGGYTGRSLNSVGSDGKWHQTWTDTAGQRLELVGGLVEGKMVLAGETPSADPKNPAPTRNRITWSVESGGMVRQLWETSADAGRTWTSAFDGRYYPATSEATLPEGFFRRIGGAWIGSGSVMRRDAHVELLVERGVGSTIRLHWRNVMQGPSRSVFEGSAVYEKKSDHEYTAQWWDSQGARHAIVATASADGATLTSLWGEAGKTVYSLLESGELEVVDAVKHPGGSWSEFGRTKLKRQ